MILYLDANAIIYSVEGRPGLRAAALRWIEEIEASAEGVMVTSRLSLLECRVKPLRERNHERLARIDGFFVREKLVLAEVTASVVERATEIRATHGFRTPDALHMATAILEGSDVFLTGDANLAKCPGLRVEVLTADA
jgi:predicted nucleic acid-binding protein